MTNISQYSSLVELHHGPLSTVWSGVDTKKGSRETTVVIKAYNKDAMLPRHVRNVIREKRILQVFNDNRYAETRQPGFVAPCRVRPLD